MTRRATHRLALTLACTAAAALVLSACGGGSPGTTTTTTTTTATTTPTTSSGAPPTTAVPGTAAGAGTWSAPLTLAKGVDLSVVSCPVAGTCLAGSAGGLSYRLTGRTVAALGGVGPAPSPQGVSYLTCTSAAFCAAVPNLNQAVLYNGSAWSAPVTIPGAQGFESIVCVGTTFCVAIDGEGNSFVYNGTRWSGNVGRLGRGQPDLLRLALVLRGRRGRAVGVERALVDPTQRRRPAGPAQLGLVCRPGLLHRRRQCR